MWNKLLSAETWVNTHEQHHVNHINHIFQHAYGSRRIKRDTRFHPRGMNLLNSAMQMRTGFIMHIHHHCLQASNLLNIALGLHNHEMHI